MEGGAVTTCRVLADACPLHLLDLLEQGDVNTLLVNDITAGVRAGHDGGAEGLRLLHSMDGDISRSGDGDPHAVKILASLLQHSLGEEHHAVAGGLGTHQGTTPGETLAGEHTGLVAIGDALVLTEQVTDLAHAHADVAGGHVGALADVTVQLGHERLAEPHDLALGGLVRIEVRTALRAADGKSGEGVLEDLLESEELDDSQVHRLPEPQTTLVRAEHRGVLHAETAIDTNPTRIVHPRDSEDDLPFRFTDA